MTSEVSAGEAPPKLINTAYSEVSGGEEHQAKKAQGLRKTVEREAAHM